MKPTTQTPEQQKANEWFKSLLSIQQIQLAWAHFQTRYPSKLGDEHRLIIYLKYHRKKP